jgi:hypothetical protein
MLFNYLLLLLLLCGKSSILSVFFNAEALRFGFRNWGLIQFPMLYISSCALLVFIFPLWCDNKSWFIKSLLCGFSFILTGTRANMMASIVLVVYIVYTHISRLQKKFFLCISIFMLILSLPKLTTFMQETFFNNQEYSLNVKSNHARSYYVLFYNNPVIFLFGSGVGSTFFDFAENSYVSITELTYLESIRIFGIILCIPLFFFLFIPVIKLTGCFRVAYIMYLFILGTNPLLYSSTGFTAIVMGYLKMCKPKNYITYGLNG